MTTYQRDQREISVAPLVALACLLLALLASLPAFADEHSCPADRPYPRGKSACDSCDADNLTHQYSLGALSETRASAVFDHEIRVTVFCDANRPVDVEDVFAQLRRTEEEFMSLFGRSLDRADGLVDDEQPRVQEVVVGICDMDDTVDDCAMYALCRDGLHLSGCALTAGSTWQGLRPTRTREVAGHLSFVPWLPEDVSWWSEGNRYGNLHHEYAHVLDYTYTRYDPRLGKDSLWWVEGLAQYIQSVVLDETISWRRGNYHATLLETFTNRGNTDEYYEGLRVFAYLRENDPWTLERMVDVVKSGIYLAPERHQYWHDLLGHTSWRHQRAWEWWNSAKDDRYNASLMLMHPPIEEQPRILGPVSVHPQDADRTNVER